MDRTFLKDTKRLVVKIGTNSIMREGTEINLRKLDRLAFVLSSLVQEGIEVVLVTSGAIGAGAILMNLDKYPESIPDQQAISAIGQTHLMTIYGQFFRNYNQHVGQILFTKDVVEFSISRENMKNALNRLLEKKIIPIINENDAVSVEELNHSTRFGDNDTLSAVVAQEIEADLLIILSDVAGLYDKNPTNNHDAKLIEYVPQITEDIKAMAQGKGFEFSKGGMGTKLNAAEIMLNAGASMIIASAKNPDIIFSVLEGENVGTLFTKA
jgi:glutamate 5-kinase